MSTESESSTASQSVAVIGELIKAAADDQNVKQAGGELGKAALTITKAVNNALMPLAAVNFAFEKAKVYFSTRFQNDIHKKLEGVPQEDLSEPKASIAGPALQGLAFSYDEDALREMYLNLLTSAMNKKTSASVHPAFVEIIKQLSAEEVFLLANILKRNGGVEMVQVRLTNKSLNNFHIVHRNFINLVKTGSSEPLEDPRVSSQIDNWVRLGLVSTGFDRKVAGEEAYEWVATRPEYIKQKETMETNEDVLSYERGYIERTSLGLEFAKAVGIIQ